MYVSVAHYQRHEVQDVRLPCFNYSYYTADISEGSQMAYGDVS